MLDKKKVNETFKKAEKGDKKAIKTLVDSKNGIIFNENGQLNPGFASRYYTLMAQIKARGDVVDYFQECIKLDIQARYEKAFQEYQSELTKTKLSVLEKHSAKCHGKIKEIAMIAAKGFNELSMQISEDDANNMESRKMQLERLDEQKEKGTLNDSQYDLRVKSLDKRYDDIFSFLDSSFNDFMHNQKTQLDNTLSNITKFVDEQAEKSISNKDVIDGEYREIN